MRTEWMTNAAPAPLEVSRRGFLKMAGVAGSGLVLGFYMPERGLLAADAPKPVYPPNAFLRIAPDNSVTVMVNRLEFGQGVNTSLPMIIAEELDADWALVRSELAPAAPVYNDPAFGIQMTGGSGSIAHSFGQYREIGAKARAMLIAAAAQEWKVKPEQVKAAKSMLMGPGGKKASYGAMAEVAMKLPVPEQVKLKDPKEFKLIGKPVPRLDARAKSTGHQKFGIDHVVPDAKVVLVARPPVFGAKLLRFDASKALAIKGVRAAIKVDTDRGGSGVAVIADGFWPAKQGREALTVEWDTSAVEKVSSTEQIKQFRDLVTQPGIVAREADTSKLAGAAKKISAVFEFPYLAHAPMEPLNCVIDLKETSCVVWAGSQFQTFDAMAIARTAGLKPENVQLKTMMAGGGFGRRAVPTSDYIVEAVNIAKAYRETGNQHPLKVMWTREDDIRGGYYRPSHVHKADIGLDEHGKIVAWDHHVAAQSIISGTPFEGMMIKNGVDATMVEGLGEPYEVPLKLSVHNVKANVPVLWWRSVGSTHTAYVMETLIDEAATLAGKDPVEYRRSLLGKDSERHLAALNLAVEKSGYGKRKLPTGHAFGVAMHQSFNTVIAYVVEASVMNGQPKLHRVTAGVHCNRAINPMSIEAQVQGAILMGLGMTLPGAAITLKDGVVEQQNFSDYVVARMPDMPHVDVHIVASQDAPTGMGEPGLPPLAPAFANALAKLTGKRLRRLPFDLASA